MINIEVDEAYAFDYLAILYVKMSDNPTDQNNKNYENAYNKLLKQLDALDAILNTREYEDLVTANRILFEVIEHIRKEGSMENYMMSAVQLDNLNTDRWKAKKALQAKYFTSAPTEVKTLNE